MKPAVNLVSSASSVLLIRLTVIISGSVEDGPPTTKSLGQPLTFKLTGSLAFGNDNSGAVPCAVPSQFTFQVQVSSLPGREAVSHLAVKAM